MASTNWLNLSRSAPPPLVAAPPNYIANAPSYLPGHSVPIANNVQEQDLGDMQQNATSPALNTSNPALGRGFIQSTSQMSPDSPVGNTIPVDTADTAPLTAHNPQMSGNMSNVYDSQRWTISPQGTLISPGREYEYEWSDYDKKNLPQEPSAPWYRRRRWITCFVVTGILLLLLIILLPIIFLVIIPKAVRKYLVELNGSSQLS